MSPSPARQRRAAPGLLFLIAVGVLLAAALGGGQVWAVTGSVPLGVTAAIVITTLLSLGVRPLLRRLAVGRQVFGEQRGLVDEDEFVDVVDIVADPTPRGRIARGVEARPDRVAGSVRSLLGRSGSDRRRR